MLANPAISVMPVMALRESCPYSRTREANAASYSPLPIAKPSSAHAANSVAGLSASPSATSPPANTRLVPTRTGRPPCRSIRRPDHGPTRAETTRASEKAAKTVGVVTPTSRAIGTASMAGR